MRTTFLAVLAAALFSQAVQAADGLVRVRSAHDVEKTADRLVDTLEQKGMTVFDRIDHAAGAVWLGYNDPAYLAARHGIEDCADVIARIEQALAGFARAAAREQE